MPTCCVFCGTPRRHYQSAICTGCEGDLPWIPEQCPRCARPLAAEPGSGVVCAECQLRPAPFEAAVAPLAFEFPVDAAVRHFKFHRKLHYARAFGELLCKAAARLPADIDGLLPVPLHWTRHGIRGYTSGGVTLDTNNRLDFSKIVEMARPVYFEETGTPMEKVSMAYNAERCRDTYTSDGSPAACGVSDDGGWVLNGAPAVPGGPYNDPCIDDKGLTLKATPSGTAKT